jgi:pimeloyl-ACP methyl ester carboxylesterase
VRVRRYDGRGIGLSDRDVDGISFAAFERDLAAVVEATNLERFALFGLSQGGATAASYAARHPERVSRLILCGAYAQGRNRRGSTADAATS